MYSMRQGAHSGRSLIGSSLIAQRVPAPVHVAGEMLGAPGGETVPRRAARGSHLQVAQRDPAQHQQVTVGQWCLLDATAVDEGPVGAAVVEDARAGGVVDEPRVAARDRVLVQ